MTNAEKEFWDVFHDEVIMYMNENQRIEIQEKLIPLLEKVKSEEYNLGYKFGMATSVRWFESMPIVEEP